MILFVDTETTGFVRRREPGNLAVQPHIVEAACVWLDVTEKNEPIIYGSFSALVKPDGWEIPPEATQIHGITNDMAQCGGLPVASVIGCVGGMMKQADLVVAHNSQFDRSLFEIEFERMQFPNDYLETPWFCTMRESTDIVKLPPNAGYRDYMWPSLGEAYSFLTGKEFQETHRALNHVQACIEIFLHLRDRWQHYLKG